MLAHTGIGWAISTAMIDQFARIGASDLGAYRFDHQNLFATILLSVLAPIIVDPLALLPATRRWCMPHTARQYM